MRERKLLRRGLLDLTILLCFMGVLGRVYDGERAVETAAVGEKKPLPIIMYHSILKDPERAGDYVAAAEQVDGCWCPGSDSNRHSSRKRILSPPRLPIPPPGHSRVARH